MGELWVAEHLGLGTEVVVKFISAQLSDRPGAPERFAREAAAAARVNSPHVVKVLDYGASADGAPFLVMEKLEGQDLAVRVAECGSLPAGVVAQIVRQLAKALTKAHAAGIVHRDIKPANVFLCATEGELFVKLLDFGVAKTAASNLPGATVSGVCVGTPSYMSPEQIVASKELDSRADLWSLGVLAFHCLTGKRPFEGDTHGAVLLAIRTLALPKVTRYAPFLPEAVDAWFERACAWEAEDRFGSAIEMANALAQALAVSIAPLLADASTEERAGASAEQSAAPEEKREATVLLEASTLSRPGAVRDDSLLKSSATPAPEAFARRRIALPVLALASVVAVGVAVVASNKGVRPVATVASAGGAEAPIKAPIAKQLRPEDERLVPGEEPTPQVAEERVAPVVRPIPVAAHSDSVARHAAKPVAASAVEAPLAVSSAPKSADVAPPPAPSAAPATDPSHLYVMPDDRR